MWKAVQGTLFASDGVTPVTDGQITLTFQGGLFAGNQLNALAGPQGQFNFVDVPVGRLPFDRPKYLAGRLDQRRDPTRRRDQH